MPDTQLRKSTFTVSSVLCIVSSGCALLLNPDPKPELAKNPEAWNLVWAEEFNADVAPDPEGGYE